MKWSRDGDLYVSKATLGHYRIDEWNTIRGADFILRYRRISSDGWKSVGTYSTIANAKSAAENYDGYRAAVIYGSETDVHPEL